MLIITQSNLIGKWLTMECMHRGATIISANHLTDKELLKTSFDMAEIVFSATGVKHLIGEDILPSPQPSPNRSARRGRPLEEKVLIDIGWGSDENGPHGDIDREYFQDKVKAVTPVPGGVGPSTVASLFANMCR